MSLARSTDPGDRFAVVLAAHAALDSTIGETPAIRDHLLRIRLLDEECDEVTEALAAGDLAHIGGELSDLLYVTYGAAVTFGLTLPDLAPLTRMRPIAVRPPALVRASTMTRAVERAAQAIEADDLEAACRGLLTVLVAVARIEGAIGLDLGPFYAEVARANIDKAGGTRRADGKWQKPAGWRGPDLAGVLARQLDEQA